jgi:quercetin dioxygenase-like cupin family protein
MAGEPRGIAVASSEGEVIRSPIGGDVRFVARGAHTDGAMTALDVAVPPGQGPPLHLHHEQDEAVYVLEGNVRWKLGEELSASREGSFVFIPRGLAHCFQNVGDAPARLMITFMPAGMESFFELQAHLSAFDPEAFRSAAAENGMEVVGPPLAESDPL